MIQIGLLVLAVGLLFGGLWPLLGMESPEKKTHPAVAMTMIVIAIGLGVFALAILPKL